MKVLVSYMFSNGPLAITRGHTDLEMQYWDTKAVTEKLGEFLNVDPTTIIISSVFEIPTSRFTPLEKANLKHWVQLANEFIESDDDVQYGIIQNLIKELNE